MPLPVPTPGLVVQYDYLWLREHRMGRSGGAKSRPCVVVVATETRGSRTIVTVAPITHRQVDADAEGVLLTPKIKRRLGLDALPSWIVATELNRFIWPGPDLRSVAPGRFDYGFLPVEAFAELRSKLVTISRSSGLTIISRSR